MGPITNNPRQCNLVELEGYGPSTGATMISAYEVGVIRRRFREVSEKVLQGQQDTIGLGYYGYYVLQGTTVLQTYKRVLCSTRGYYGSTPNGVI